MMKAEDELVDEKTKSSTSKSSKKDVQPRRKRRHNKSSASKRTHSTKRKSKGSLKKKQQRRQQPSHQQQRQIKVSKKHSTATTSAETEKESPFKCCYGIVLCIQLGILALCFIATMLAAFYLKNEPFFNAVTSLAFAEAGFLIVLLFGICISCCTWFSVINCILLLLGEFGFSLWLTIMDIPEECHEVGCTFLKGELIHRIVLVGMCLIFAGIHAIMAASIPAVLCITAAKSDIRNPEAASVQKVQQVHHTRQPLQKRRRRNVSTSRSRSRSCSRSRSMKSGSSQQSGKSARVHVAQRVPVDASSRVSTLSWKTQPSSQFASTCPSTNSSQQLSLTASSSTCPYSAAIVAHSQALKQQQQQRQQQQAPLQQPMQQPLQQQQTYQQSYPSAVPVIPQQPPPQSQYPSYPGPIPSSDTVSVTFPSAASNRDPVYQSYIVRIPQYGHPQQHPHAQQHDRQQPVGYPNSGTVAPPPPQYYNNNNAALNQPAPASESSIYNLSQTSENRSVVLPNSFASQDSMRGSQGIFIANTPSNNKN